MGLNDPTTRGCLTLYRAKKPRLLWTHRDTPAGACSRSFRTSLNAKYRARLAGTIHVASDSLLPRCADSVDLVLEVVKISLELRLGLLLGPGDRSIYLPLDIRRCDDD